MFEKKVRDFEIGKTTDIKNLAEQLAASGGFVAKKAGTAVGILEKMLSEAKIKFLSFPACIVSTGTRGIIKEAIKRNFFDIVITTCGTLDHDFARLYEDYYHGTFDADDSELHKKGINRLGNVFIPNKSYGEAIEKNLQPLLADIYASGKKHLSTYEFVWELGSRLKMENREQSIIYWCWKNKIPMIIPGITDGAFGTQMLMFMQDHRDFVVDIFADEQFLMDKMFSSKGKSGALMIGGGISKHHVIWWSQFKEGLDYAVYLTTAPEWDGSLSGARTREAVSWGKLKESAQHVTVEGDATVLLPIILGALFD